MNVEIIFEQMLILLIIMSVGYAANKINLLNPQAEKILSKLIVNITCPALIISSVSRGETCDKKSILIVLLAATLYYIIIPLPSFLITKIFPCSKAEKNQLMSMLIYSNIGFMGIPLAESIYGNEGVIYISMFMLVFNISVFSYGTILLGGGEGKLKPQNFINPGTVSAVAALIIYMSGMSFPAIIYKPIEMMGEITTPAAMLVIGSTLADYPLKDILKDKKILLFSLLKMFIIPVIIGLLIKLFNLEPVLLYIIILVAAMPAASNIIMICNEYDQDCSVIARGTFWTTIFSVISIPAVIMILSSI